MILNEQVAAIRAGVPESPPALFLGLGGEVPSELWTAGPIALLDQPKTGFFCSSQCPGSVVLKTFDTITRMRNEGQVLIGGFHSVMEWECLGILLRGRQPIIWVPARSIVGMHLRAELVPAFNDDRLLILSPFPPKDKRITASLCDRRNRFIAALTDSFFVPYAAPNSRTQSLCDELRAAGKRIQNVSQPSFREKC